MKAEDIFLAALDRKTAERQAYLDDACCGDSDLLAQVEGLLHSHESADSFLNSPLFNSAVTTDGQEYVSELAADPDGEFPLDFLAPSSSPDALGRIGPYEVTERIGRGGMGLVLKARDAKLNRVVAIKVLAPELATNPTARKRFQREAHAAAAVVHQHVVTIHAVDEDRLPYLVMECIDGQSLQQKIDREGHLELKEILRIGQQIAAGLAAAHAQGLMHRDVKPANILLENGVERVRITDFGLARAVDDVGVTRTGEVAGTPQYMSPEQAQGLPVDARSDLFSLGCVLYAMCTGRSPFRAETTFATVRRVCEDKPRPIREVNPEIPQWLATLIDRLLAKQPAERFQAAKEVADLLGEYLADMQAGRAEARKAALESSATEANRPLTGLGSPKSRRRGWIVAGAALGCVVLLAGAALYFNPFRTRLATVVLRAEDVLTQLVGTWSIDVETTLPKPDTAKGVVRFDWVAGEQFLRSYTTYDQGSETLTVHRYAGDGTNFKRWFLSSQSAIQAIQSGTDGEWDMKTQTMTYRGSLPLWHKITHVERWVDVNHVEITTEIKDQLGEVTLRQTKKMQRTQDMAVVPKAPVDPKRPAEFALLDRQVGSWINTLEVTLAELAGQTFQSRTTNETVPILAHRFVESNEKHEHGGGKEYWLLGYDELRRIYRLWHFGGDGEAMEADGAWNPKEKMLAWKSLDGRFTGSWTFPNDDERHATMSAKDAQGRPLFDVTGISRRDGAIAANGPGPAYERWKKTPDQQWLEETGQLKDRAAAKPETGAFVVLGGAGVAELKFDTLADAVQGASDGDTIEIRGNGPFVSEPVNCGQTALTIRAGAGFRPIIEMRPEFTEDNVHMLATKAALVLEGLEFQRARSKNEEKGSRFAVHCADAQLWAANCRFNVAVFSPRASRCVFRNCDFLGSGGWVGGERQSGSTFIFENCLHRNSGAYQIGFGFPGGLPRDASIRIRRSTFASSKTSLTWTQKTPLSDLPKLSGDALGMSLDVADSIFDVQGVLGVEQGGDQVTPLEPAEAVGTLLRLVRWRGERNLFAGGRPLLAWSAGWKLLPQHGPQSLEEWKPFWNTTESGSLEGRVEFQGGNLASRTDSDRLAPDDFRLREGSLGHRALPGGQDVGADMSLVGPGDAYGRWKQTPEYKEWLTETTQVTSPRATKAFVVLGGPGVAEREFDTLAEAVLAASDGDTIEIRGNGPFVTDGVTIGQRLVIRAGPGHTPTITLSQAAADTNVPLLTSSAPLVLEGLELRRVGGAEGPFEGRYPILVKPWKGELSVSNCRFVLNTSLGHWSGVIAAGSSVCTVRNCQFIGTDATAALAWNCPPGGRGTMENCVSCACDLMSVDVRSSDVADVSIQIRRNTTVGDCLVLGFDEARKPAGEAPIRLDFSENITSCAANEDYAILRFDQRNLEPPLAAEGAEEVLRALVALQEQHNVYAAGARMLHHGKRSQDGFSFLAASQAKDLVDWNRFWMQTDTGSREGAVHFQGGDLFQRTLTNPQKLTPDDFRLRADSAGYRAGPDGKDLGADVELIGPGAAYEHWKQTPEYQQWLNDTKQVTRARSANREPDAAARELAKWQGEWENAEYGKLLIQGERWSSHPKNGLEVVSTIKIVEVTDEMTHLLLLSAGVDGKVRTIQTILRVDGDTLHNCGTIGSVRPAEFTNKPGCIYTQWKRVTKQLTGAQAARPESEGTARERAKWQGEWENADYGELVIHGERWASHPKDGFEVVSTIKIVEVTDEMTHILLQSAGVDGKVRTIQTILRVDGDTLHNCGTIGSVRPTEFANKPGCIYTQWKRVSSPPP